MKRNHMKPLPFRGGKPLPYPTSQRPLYESGEVVLHQLNLHLERVYPTKPKTLRLSAAGSCQRKLAYGIHFPEHTKPLGARYNTLLELGNLIHDSERKWISEVTHLHSVEKEVKLKIPERFGLREFHVTGHIDGIIELKDGPMLLDIKTMNSKNFKEFLEFGVSPDYVAQLTAYMGATGIHRAILWAYNKDTSQRSVRLVRFSRHLLDSIVLRFQKVKASTPTKLPEREYSPQDEIRGGKPSGRQYLPYQCSYCDFVELCWKPEGFEAVSEGNKIRWLRQKPEKGAEEWLQ